MSKKQLQASTMENVVRGALLLQHELSQFMTLYDVKEANQVFGFAGVHGMRLSTSPLTVKPETIYSDDTLVLYTVRLLHRAFQLARQVNKYRGACGQLPVDWYPLVERMDDGQEERR